ncbi:MAG: flavodoxin domain-containing protein [Verrucomicrobiales bacterium]|nr:flavodoxin domain-containing protein [Verrucomicrobiales bacterium]
MTQTLVPVLPESAPFTPEQRAYLNGFLAGLFSRAPVPPNQTPGAQPSPAARLQTVTILSGSQTGTAEKLAKRLAKEGAKRGFAATIRDLAGFTAEQLAAETNVLVVASTYGDGEPPDNARAFWKTLGSETAPRLEHLRFSVCALGDSNYPRFCQFGKDLDARLAALGARCIHGRQDCDVEFERPFQSWLSEAFAQLAAGNPAPHGTVAEAPGSLSSSSENPDEAETGWARERPYPARLKTNRRLSGPDSSKDVRHLEINLGDSGIQYEVGDALGVWPTQCPELADTLLQALGYDGEEAVVGRDDATVPLRLALTHHFELGRIPVPLLEFYAKQSGDPQLLHLVSPSANGELPRFQRGRDVLDLVSGWPGVRPTAAEFVSRLRRLQPRLYSISSSPKAHPGEVHLTVSAVRHESLGRSRRGVASCFLADRCGPETPLPVYLHANSAFRPPAGDVPLIMIGPGTGIAPFRAFLEERRAVGANGRNWLFFGDQHERSDYLYREQIEEFQRSGHLHRLDLAWSRDQDAKVYVQHRLREQGRELWRWLEDGAAIAVCGDASRMAKDVDDVLREVIQEFGGKTPEAAAEHLQTLQAQRRYLRDVY